MQQYSFRADCPLIVLTVLLVLTGGDRGGDPQKKGGFSLRLDMPHGPVVVTGTPDGLEIRQDVEISGPPENQDRRNTASAGQYPVRRGDLPSAMASGDVKISGDRDMLERFVRSFPMPHVQAAVPSR